MLAKISFNLLHDFRKLILLNLLLFILIEVIDIGNLGISFKLLLLKFNIDNYCILIILVCTYSIKLSFKYKVLIFMFSEDNKSELIFFILLFCKSNVFKQLIICIIDFGTTFTPCDVYIKICVFDACLSFLSKILEV